MRRSRSTCILVNGSPREVILKERTLFNIISTEITVIVQATIYLSGIRLLDNPSLRIFLPLTIRKLSHQQ